MSEIRIAHISDLHLGKTLGMHHHVRPIIDALATHIASQSPDLILCTGDIVHSPYFSRGFQLADEFLRRLNASTGNKPVKFVPGNHDIGIYGLLGSRSLFGGRFSKFVEANELRCCEPFIIGNAALFGLDSNPDYFLFNARGEITQDTIFKLEAAVRTARREHDLQHIILVLHHHPLPVPAPGLDTNISMKQAGLLLRTLGDIGINTVLHGHKHHSHITEITTFRGGSSHSVTILGAGSVSRKKDHEAAGNQYQIITLWPEGSVSRHGYTVTGNTGFIEGDLRDETCKSSESAVRESWEKTSRDARYTIDLLEVHTNVSTLGDASYMFCLKGVKVSSGNVPRIELTKSVRFGTLTVKRVKIPQMGGVTVKTSASYDTETGYTMTVSFVFKNSLLANDNPIDLMVELEGFGNFVMNKVDQVRFQNPPYDGRERADLKCDFPAKDLIMTVSGPAGIFEDASVGSDIEDRNGYVNPRLNRGNCSVLHIENNRIFSVYRYPLMNATYTLSWNLPGSLSYSQGALSEDLQDVLSIPADILKNFLDPLLRNMLNSFMLKFGIHSTIKEQIDISLFLFDSHSKRLRLIGALLDFKQPIWKWPGFAPGVGLAGRAFYLKKHLFFSAERQPIDGTGYLRADQMANNELGLVDHEALVCSPLMHPGNTVVGVICIGSFDGSSVINEIPHSLEDDYKIWSKEQSVVIIDSLRALVRGRSSG